MESGILQALNLSTLIATKASRIVWAARQRRVAEFAVREAHNPLVVARSSYIGGAASTSLLAAAFEYRLHATATVPHALIELFPTEEEAFQAVAGAFNRYTLPLNTYDPQRAIHTAIAVAHNAQDSLGHTLAAVSLDNGDLVAGSRYVREQLIRAGMGAIRILGSGHLDEYRITDLLEHGAQFDAFGVGTALGTGAGSVARGAKCGALGVVYKEVAYVDEDGAEHSVIKVAGEKTTWPGRKEVYRHPGWKEDLVQVAAEPVPTSYTLLLRSVVRSGKVVPGSLPPLGEIWELARANLHALPEQYHALTAVEAYPVRFSPALQALRAEAAQAAKLAAVPGAHGMSPLNGGERHDQVG